MNKPIIIIFCLFFLATTTQAAEHLTPYFLKRKLVQYHDSGRYDHEIKHVMYHAKKCLVQQIHNIHDGKKPALVLDIDDTSLSLYHYERVLSFDLTQKEIEFIMEKTNPPAVPATLSLYNFAKNHGITVFFISGRHEAWRAATIRSLQAAGYKNWGGLYLRPDDYHEKSITPFKSSARKLLRSQGYDIIGNIGDQISDLAGEGIQCAFKLPNPYYFIAEDEVSCPFAEDEKFD